MKTQISRENHDTEKRYSGVYQQQGRMLTDADWNELTDIVKERLDDALVDVVGSGTPRHRKLQIIKNGIDWEIIPGHLYADGVIAHLPGQPGQNIHYDAQPDLTSPRPIPADCFIYADVWERTVTALEDGGLMDSALHGADTCTRTKTMLQIKWCDTGTQADQLPKIGDAELTMTIREGITAPDLCDPCAAEISVDARTGNELFRLEVHDVRYQGNDPTKQVKEVWLKWSCENGAEQYALKDRDGNAIVPPEAFKEANRVYEFFNTETEQNPGVHPKGTPLPGRGEINKGYSRPVAGKPQDYVRRWDGYCVLKKTAGSWSITQGHDQTMLDFTASPEVTLDAVTGALRVGLEAIHFELPVNGQKLLTGDYWTAPLREREIRAELDKKAADSSYAIPALLDAETPHGMLHHYLELATVSGGNLLDDPDPDPEADRKYAFPPLTEMTRMFMAGGDGQEVIPGDALPQPLRVGVANGEWPVEGATVRFQVDEVGGGFLNPVNGEVKTGPDGIAECEWIPGTAMNTDYRVKASLVDPDHAGDASKDMDPPVYFYANLITADQVVYEPDCPDSGENTVHSLLATDAAVSLDLGADGYYTVKEALDSIMCHLDAAKLPYEPGCAYLQSTKTVKEAIDLLCIKETGGGCCTITISEGDDLTARLAAELAPGDDAHICITHGQYIVKQPVIVEDCGHITIQGCGDGTFIRAPNSESVFVFNQCKSVVVRNMALQSDTLGDRKASEYDHLNGALTISDVDKVVVECVTLTCAAGGKKMASCLTVAHNSQADSVCIRKCHLNPGHQQVGMLLVNANMARIEENKIHVRPKSRHAVLKKLLKNKEFRLPIRKMMLSDVIVVDAKTPTDVKRNVEVGYEGRKLRFQTSESLKQAWDSYLEQLPPEQNLNDRDLIRYVKDAADSILLNQGVAPGTVARLAVERTFTSDLGGIANDSGLAAGPVIDTGLGAGPVIDPGLAAGPVIKPDSGTITLFKGWYDAMSSHLPAIASQGIVCAGRIANDICITRNSIHGVSQGVHIGLSHRDSERDDPDIAGRLMLTGNHVVNYLSAQQLGEWHGLFVGNFDCLHIENNHLELEKHPYNLERAAYGIRVYGYFGTMLQVRGNRLNGYESGIFASAFNSSTNEVSLWQVENNMIAGATIDPVLVPQHRFITANNMR